MINIRIANQIDIPQLEELFYITRKQTFVNRPESEFHIGDYKKSTAEDQVWVAELQGVIAGFASIYPKENFIHNLFVGSLFQGQGVGKKLLQTAEEMLSFPITLKIAIDNPSAKGFYEHQGWRQISMHLNAIEPYWLYQKG